MHQGLRDRLLTAYVRGGRRGFDRLLKLVGHRPGNMIRTQTKFGSWLDLDPWSYIDRFVLAEGYYESEVVLALADVVRDGGVVWDVGANIGLHGSTLPHLAPNARVISFEPSPAILGALWRNLSLNIAAPEVVTTALSDQSGQQLLHISGSGNPGMTTLTPWSGATYAATALVPTERGDNLVAAGLPVPAAIKLDVEGHEERVLRGMPEILAAPTCRAVVFEAGAEPDAPCKVVLTAAGFELRELERQEGTGHALRNYLATRL